MPASREGAKIEAMQKLLTARLNRADIETVVFTFAEMLKEPALKDVSAIKATLNLIQQRSNGRISWEAVSEQRMLQRGISAADTEYRPSTPLPPVEVGASIHVFDPEQLGTYFREVLAGSTKKTRDSGKRLIEKDERGNFLYNGKKIEMGDDTVHRYIFEALLEKADTNGFLSYEDIEEHLVANGQPAVDDKDASKKRILNAATNQHQGLFHTAKVGGKPLPNKTPRGEVLIKIQRGKGLNLNNPLLG